MSTLITLQYMCAVVRIHTLGLCLLSDTVFQVAKAWQPSVVYIGECERTWMKKVPKTDKDDPKRVKKALPKILKTMKAEDRVMIIGVTKSPFSELYWYANEGVCILCSLYV